MIYDSLLVIFRLIAGIMTKNALVLSAVIGIVVYVIWAGVGAFLSFGRKFYKRCDGLTEYVKSCDGSEAGLAEVENRTKNISVGLARGVSTYAKNRTNTPSAYISKSESLDSEVRGGIFNHGKSLMRAYINFTTILLFVLNIEFFGVDKVFSASIIAQAAVLPVVYYFIIKVFYFLYNSIQQQFYKMDVESFCELTNALDEKFGKAVEVVNTGVANQTTVTVEDVQQLSPELPQETPEEIQEEQVEEKPEEVEEVVTPPEPPKKTLDDYDFFKKKNIDVEKLKGEVPANPSVMPYIDVDSDYVIKDDENTANSYHPNATNGSEVLGGMLQNMAGIKKTEESKAEPESVEEEKPVENTESVKTPEEKPAEGKPAEEKSDDFEDIFSGLEEFKVDSSESDNAEVAKDIAEETKTEDGNGESDATPSLSEEENIETEKVDVSKAIEKIDELSNEAEKKSETPSVEVEDGTFETPAEDAQNFDKNDIFEQETSSEETEPEPVRENNENSNIANIVGKFKPKSKLASGGVVIERNYQRTSDFKPKQEKEVHILNADSDADSVLSSFKNSTTIGQMGQEEYSNPYETQNIPGQNYYGQNYQNPTGYNPQNTFVSMSYNNNYAQPNYMGTYQNNFNGYANQNQSEFYSDFNGNYGEQQDFEEEETVAQPAPKPKREYKPRATAPRKKVEKPTPKEEDVEEAKRRGRPAKQVFDETVSIKDDKEFEQVLSRAEKLMRKSEQGLSQSQAKRVEKELKSLLEAMNRYKEGK